MIIGTPHATNAARRGVPQGFVFGTRIMLLRLSLLATIALAPLRAFALDIGACGTPEEMTAKLKAEGQRSAAMADQVPSGKMPYAVIFTTNSDGSVGYVMASDKMTDERASRFCVQERLTDLRWHDARKSGIPSAAKLKSSDADAEKRCDELMKVGKITLIQGDIKRACASLNVLLEERDKLAIRPMLQGFIVAKTADGAFQRTGGLLTVLGDVSTRTVGGEKWVGTAGGMVYTWLPEGASIIDKALILPKYTEYGLSLLP